MSSVKFPGRSNENYLHSQYIAIEANCCIQVACNQGYVMKSVIVHGVRMAL